MLVVVAFGCAALAHKSAATACDVPGCIDSAAFTSPRDMLDTAADEFRSPSTNRSHVFFCKSTRKARDEKVAISTGLLEEPTKVLTFLCDTEHGHDSKTFTRDMLIGDSLGDWLDDRMGALGASAADGRSAHHVRLDPLLPHRFGQHGTRRRSILVTVY